MLMMKEWFGMANNELIKYRLERAKKDMNVAIKEQVESAKLIYDLIEKYINNLEV